MLVVRKPSTKYEKSTKRLLEFKNDVVKSKLKTPRNKSIESNNNTSISKANYKKIRSTFKTSKRTTHHSTCFRALSNNIKTKINIYKTVREDNPTISIVKVKKSISNDKVLNLGKKKVKKDMSNIPKIKIQHPELNNFFILSHVPKSESKTISNSKLISRKSKSLSTQDPIAKNQSKNIKRSKNESIHHNKNGSKNSTQSSAKKEHTIVRKNSKLKTNVMSSSLDGKSLVKVSRKIVNGTAKQKANIGVETISKPEIVMAKTKSLQSDTTQKIDLSHDTNKSSSYRKKVTGGNSIAPQSMQRKINSLELMNNVYPRVEVISQSTARYSGNSRTKSDLTTQKLHSDMRNQLKMRSKTYFDFKKPGSAPEQRKGTSKIQRLSSSIPSKQTAGSLNDSKASLCSSPKWYIHRLGIPSNDRGNDLFTFKAIVESAKMKHKTFTCCGGYRSIRSALELRGWIERINIYHSGYDDLTKQLYKLPISDLMHGIHDKISGVIHRRVILSKLMGSHQVDLYWDYSHDVYHGNPDSIKLTLINSIQRGVFSYATKHGLCESSKDAHWYNKPGKCHLRHPRSYSLPPNQKPEEFIKDFKVTACMSLLKWIVEIPRTKSSKLCSEHGNISIQCFQFALKECMKLIRKLKHEDIDKTIPESSDKDWINFLEAYSEAVHMGSHFKTNIYETESTIIHKSNVVLDKLKKCWPYCDMDGFMNIWILKPSNGSRGIGIHICRTLAYILRILSENKNSTYVIQKYIERPLLIFNTKFDIRQWFLISSTNPLTIWMYKDCYLRFSSQTYNLRKLHESIHLTNNSVQSRYHSTVNRDPSIPTYNMWDLNTFKQHLINIGYAGIFESIIYPGMKECITAAILMNQDHLNKRKNSFQLHGADFMLTEDFKPWLIEINARPALYSSTPVTAQMCPKVLTDTIKVMIDRKENPNAQTGLFELLYKEQVEKFPNTIFDPNQFVIQGHAIRKNYFQTPEQATIEGNLCNSRKSSEIMDITNNKNFILQVGKEMRNTLEQLLNLIQKEKNRRKMLKDQLGSSNSLKKKQLKELYKKDDFHSGDTQKRNSSTALKTVLYNTLSNNVLNSISDDAKQLHGMISKELGIAPTKQLHGMISKELGIAPTKQLHGMISKEVGIAPTKQLHGMISKELGIAPTKQLHGMISKELGIAPTKQLHGMISKELGIAPTKQLHGMISKELGIAPTKQLHGMISKELGIAPTKQLHGMISKELGIAPTLKVIPIYKTIDDNTPEIEQIPKSSESITTDIETLQPSTSEHSDDAASLQCVNEEPVEKHTGGIFTNFIGLISSLSFN